MEGNNNLVEGSPVNTPSKNSSRRRLSLQEALNSTRDKQLANRPSNLARVVSDKTILCLKESMRNGAGEKIHNFGSQSALQSDTNPLEMCHPLDCEIGRLESTKTLNKTSTGTGVRQGSFRRNKLGSSNAISSLRTVRSNATMAVASLNNRSTLPCPRRVKSGGTLAATISGSNVKSTELTEEGVANDKANWSPPLLSLRSQSKRSTALLGHKMMLVVECQAIDENCSQDLPTLHSRGTPASCSARKRMSKDERDVSNNKNWSHDPNLPSLRSGNSMSAAFLSKKTSSDRLAEFAHHHDKKNWSAHGAAPSRSKSSNAMALLGLGSGLKRNTPSTSHRKSDPSPRNAIFKSNSSRRLLGISSLSSRSKSAGSNVLHALNAVTVLGDIPDRSTSSSATLDSESRALDRPRKSIGLSSLAEMSKSACSDLLEIQKAVAGGITSTGTAVAEGITATGTALTGSIASTGTALAGGITSTGTALAGGISSTGRAVTRSAITLKKGSLFQPEQDPLFALMATWNPMDSDDRAKYDDAAVKRILGRNPDAARAKYEVKLGGRGHLTVSRYPLSTLVAFGASVETVRLAIKACPMALGPSEDFRSTPLHTACTFNASLDVVRYLYNKYPAAIKQTTNHVFLPIHNACQTAIPEPCSLALIQFLVEAYPEGLMTINKLGDTPLRTAQRNKHVTREVLEYLEEETERVFSLEENEDKREEVAERQSWGSKRKSLLKLSMRALADHGGTTSDFHLADLFHDCSGLTSEDTSAEFSGELTPPTPLEQQAESYAAA